MTIQYASAQTDAEIISNAGILCGQFDVLMNDTGNRFAQAATAMYGSLVMAELGSNRWRFALAYQELSTYTNLAPPVDIWLYEWSIPADCLMPIVPQPLIQYDIVGTKIYTNSPQPFSLKYLRAVPVNEWNPTFKHFMTYALAELMCESVVPIEKAKKIMVGRQHWESRALFADGQSVPSRSMRTIPWVDIRYSTWADGAG